MVMNKHVSNESLRHVIDFVFVFVMINKFGCIFLGVLTAYFYVYHREKTMQADGGNDRVTAASGSGPSGMNVRPTYRP